MPTTYDAIVIGAGHNGLCLAPNRPFPEASSFRLCVDGLYLCGPSTHPGGGMHAAAGYNPYKVTTEDLGLPSPVIAERGY